MPHNKKRRWAGWIVGSLVVAAVVYIVAFYDPGAEAKGATDIRGCSRLTSEFVTLEGVYIFGPEKRFQLIDGDAVDWAALKGFAARSPSASVDPVIELELECTGTRSVPSGRPRALVSTAPPQAIQHIIEKLYTWRFSPYRQGRIRYCFDVTGHRVTIDTTLLEPTTLQDADKIPVAKIWDMQSFDDKSVRIRRL